MKERISGLPDLWDVLIVIVYRSYLDPYSKKMKQCKIKSETWTVIKTFDDIMELWNKIDHIMKIVTGRWVHGSSLYCFLYCHKCLKIYFANLKINYWKTKKKAASSLAVDLAKGKCWGRSWLLWACILHETQMSRRETKSAGNGCIDSIPS